MDPTRARLGERTLFPRLEARAYLAHAAISPLSEPVVEAVQEAAGDYAARGRHAFDRWFQDRERLREDVAALMSARAEDIALVQSTTHGLGLVALSVDWRAGDRVVVFEGEYPSNVSPWQAAAERFGLRIVRLPLAPLARAAGPDFDAIEAELTRGVRLVAVSAVQFQTGLRTPLEALALRCRTHGSLLCVDAVQGLGAVPLDVTCGVDFLVAGGHKWLMGPEGVGVLYVSPASMPGLRPAIVGNMSHVGGVQMLGGEPGQLRYDRPLRADPRVFEGGMLGTLSAAGLRVSVQILRALDPVRIHTHVNAYLDALEPELQARGFESLRAPDPARRSCILALRPPAGRHAGHLAHGLDAHGVAISSPDGLLRFAPHWPNALHEVPEVLAALDATLAESPCPDYS